MKVTVIGCSTAWTDRPMSSYCLNDNILIDCGEGTTKYYKKCGVDFYGIKHIFITHFHNDHFLGLSNYIGQILGYETEKEKYRLTIYGPKGLLNALNILARNYACPRNEKRVEDYIKVVELKNKEQELNVEGLKVKTHCLTHGKMFDFGYEFDDGKTKLGFSGDCTFTPNLEKFVKECDSMFLACCSLKTSKNHVGVDKFLELKNKYPNKRLLAIHCVEDVYVNAEKLGIETAKDTTVYQF